MSYWNIRKRAKLRHLPSLPPEPVRGTTANSDPNYLRSVAWMEEYNRLRAQPETTNGHEENRSADPLGEAQGQGEQGAARET
jgi:hypothetical protein